MATVAARLNADQEIALLYIAELNNKNRAALIVDALEEKYALSASADEARSFFAKRAQFIEQHKQESGQANA